jgi:hypothetical protein
VLGHIPHEQVIHAIQWHARTRLSERACGAAGTIEASTRVEDSCLANMWAIRLETTGATVQQLSSLKNLAEHLVGICGGLAIQPYKVCLLCYKGFSCALSRSHLCPRSY